MAAGGIAAQGGRRVYVVDGARTPFLKAKTGLGPFTGSDLAVNAGRVPGANRGRAVVPGTADR